MVKKKLALAAVVVTIGLTGLSFGAWRLLKPKSGLSSKNNAGAGFNVYSTAFPNGGSIPSRNNCVADNFSPPLTFKNVPKKAQSVAIVMHDLDAPGGDFTHWLVWNIMPDIKAFNEGTVSPGSQQGTTDFGSIGYGGPCPQSGTHRYVFDSYALDSTLNLPTTIRRPELESAIKSHIVAKSSMSALVTRR